MASFTADGPVDLDGIEVSLVRWEDAAQACTEVRTRVFVDEQGVALAMEMDGLDPQCAHALAVDAEDRPVGTGRLLADGRVGRMAVLPGWRGKGVGRLILQTLEAEATRQGLAQLVLHAQVTARGFYDGAGYRPEGDEFEEAKIPHVVMVKALNR